MAGQRARQEGVPRRPGAMTAFQHPVQLAHGEGRESAGEAGRGAGGEDQFGGIGKIALAMAAGAKADGEAMRSEEHTSELQSLMRISYAVFCLKKKKKTRHQSN